MHHCGIAGTYYRGYVLQIDSLSCRQCDYEIIYVVHYAVLHLVECIIFFGVDDSANVVFAKVYLAVVRCFSIYCLGICQVDKMGHHGGCAQVNGHSEIGFTPLTRLNFYNFSRSTTPTYCHRNLVIRFNKQF
ncbi:hypothetical protein ES703_124592 [subsurface metagenome]